MAATWLQCVARRLPVAAGRSSQSQGQVGLRKPRYGEQMADGDGVDGAIIAVHLAQFRHIEDDRVVERKLSTIAQLKNGDCGHGLGNRSPVYEVSGSTGWFASRRALPKKCCQADRPGARRRSRRR